MNEPIYKFIDALTNAIGFFNFEKVEKVMEVLDWKWRGNKPDKSDLIAEVTDLAITSYKTAINSDSASGLTACGGFEVEVQKTTDESFYVTIKFVIE